MDNNQFNNQYNNQNYGQPTYQQPVQQPVYGQPAYQQPVQQPVYGQPKKANTGLIVGIVIGVIVLVGVLTTVGKGSSAKKIDGKWVCTGSKGTLTIDANASAKTVKMKVGIFSIDAKYKSSGTVKPASKKDGYKYTQYVFTSGSNSQGTTYSSSKKVGFVFGIDPNNDKVGHYVDSTKAGSMEFNCTKTN